MEARSIPNEVSSRLLALSFLSVATGASAGLVLVRTLHAYARPLPHRSTRCACDRVLRRPKAHLCCAYSQRVWRVMASRAIAWYSELFLGVIRRVKVSNCEDDPAERPTLNQVTQCWNAEMRRKQISQLILGRVSER